MGGQASQLISVFQLVGSSCWHYGTDRAPLSGRTDTSGLVWYSKLTSTGESSGKTDKTSFDLDRHFVPCVAHQAPNCCQINKSTTKKGKKCAFTCLSSQIMKLCSHECMDLREKTSWMNFVLSDAFQDMCS